LIDTSRDPRGQQMRSNYIRDYESGRLAFRKMCAVVQRQ